MITRPRSLRRDVRREQPVRADEHVDLAVARSPRAPPSAAPCVRKRESTSTCTGKGAKRSENVVKCCWARMVVGHSTMTCLPSCVGLERRADRDLGLAVAHVAADQAVHRLVGLHVGLDVRDGGELVGRLLERERRLHLQLPRRVRRRTRSPLTVARRAYRSTRSKASLRAALRALPVARDQSAVFRRVTRGARPSGPDVLRDAVELLDRHVELVALRVLEQQVVALHAEDLAARELAEERDAVRGVHDVVAGREGEREPRGVDVARARGASCARG